MKEKIPFSFDCPVDIASMPKTECGHFCGNCQKEVVDFTRYEIAEIHKYRAENGPTCGIYRAEHVVPDLIAPIEIGRKFRAAAFFTGIFVALSGQSAHAQSTVDPKREQSQGTSNAPIPGSNVEKAIEEGRPVSMSIGETEIETTSSDETKDTRTKKEQRQSRSEQKKLYRSKKFPYVRRHRVRLSGF